MASQALESTCLHICSGLREIQGSFEIVFSGPNTTPIGSVGKVGDLLLEEVAFTQLEFEVHLSEALKDCSQSQEMFIHCMEEFQVYETAGEVQHTQGILHQPLESGLGITEPKQHAFTLIKPDFQ